MFYQGLLRINNSTMDRYILTDAQWAKMEPFCLRNWTDRGRSVKDN